MQTRIEGDLITLVGPVVFTVAPIFGANTFGNTQFTAADPLLTTKYVRRIVRNISQTKTAGAAVAERRVIHVCEGTNGTVISVTAGCVTTAVGAATVTLDLYKNGSSILTGTFQITSSTTQYTVQVTGTLSVATYVTGDVFETVMTVAAGGGTLPQGVWVEVVFNENP